MNEILERDILLIASSDFSHYVPPAIGKSKDLKLIDYILLHELVHTKIKNHGPDFWKMLDEITDDKAKVQAKQVRKYSTYTL